MGRAYFREQARTSTCPLPVFIILFSNTRLLSSFLFAGHSMDHFGHTISFHQHSCAVQQILLSQTHLKMASSFLERRDFLFWLTWLVRGRAGIHALVRLPREPRSTWCAVLPVSHSTCCCAGRAVQGELSSPAPLFPAGGVAWWRKQRPAESRDVDLSAHCSVTLAKFLLSLVPPPPIASSST